MFPHTIKRVDPEIDKELLADFGGEKEGFVQIGEQKWCLPARYARHAAGFYQFPLRPDDIWIMTYPRSGTTWCQELVWLLKNDLDFKTSSKVPLEVRSPFFEFCLLQDPETVREIIEFNGNDPETAACLKRRSTPGYTLLKDAASPRHIKTHLPFSLLPPTLLDTCKVVYVARNPKDVLISYYHHNKLVPVHNYRNNLEKYCKYFKEDLVCFSPYWEHLKEAWRNRHHPNLMFLFYENLVKDLSKGIKEIAAFLDVNITDEEIQQLKNHLQIDNFKNNVTVFIGEKTINYGKYGGIKTFVRQGKVGGNDPELTEQLNKEIDDWIAKKLKEIDIQFPEKNHY